MSRCIRGILALLEVLLFFCASALTSEVDLCLERGDERSLFPFPTSCLWTAAAVEAVASPGSVEVVVGGTGVLDFVSFVLFFGDSSGNVKDGIVLLRLFA